MMSVLQIKTKQICPQSKMTVVAEEEMKPKQFITAVELSNFK
jgi:hypothetical protein